MHAFPSADQFVVACPDCVYQEFIGARFEA
jgi:hypothetical protein